MADETLSICSASTHSSPSASPPPSPGETVATCALQVEG